MHQYEVMVILDPSVEEKTVEPSLDKFLNVIRTAKGTVDSVAIWGKRRLAYEIQKKSEGIYAVINMTAPSEAVVELDRQLKLSEAVMRTKVLRAEDVQFSITPIEFVAEKPFKKAPARKSAAEKTEAPAEKAAAPEAVSSEAVAEEAK
jgi:small subunit ribosomal protein S6